MSVTKNYYLEYFTVTKQGFILHRERIRSKTVPKIDVGTGIIVVVDSAKSLRHKHRRLPNSTVAVRIKTSEKTIHKIDEIGLFKVYDKLMKFYIRW